MPSVQLTDPLFHRVDAHEVRWDGVEYRCQKCGTRRPMVDDFHGFHCVTEVKKKGTPVNVPDYSVIQAYDNDLKRFIHAMEYKLRLNAHKGKWENLEIEDALTKLSREVEELRGAIQLGNTMEIILEAADIANFAMMVASIAVERVKK